MEKVVLEIDDTASSERSRKQVCLNIRCHAREEYRKRKQKRTALQDHPSWCDHVSHSSKLLHIQLVDAHISDTAAAPSDPAGSWLMPGIASAVSPEPQLLRTSP